MTDDRTHAEANDTQQNDEQNDEQTPKLLRFDSLDDILAAQAAMLASDHGYEPLIRVDNTQPPDLDELRRAENRSAFEKIINSFARGRARHPRILDSTPEPPKGEIEVPIDYFQHYRLAPDGTLHDAQIGQFRAPDADPTGPPPGVPPTTDKSYWVSDYTAAMREKQPHVSGLPIGNRNLSPACDKMIEDEASSVRGGLPIRRCDQAAPWAFQFGPNHVGEMVRLCDEHYYEAIERVYHAVLFYITQAHKMVSMADARRGSGPAVDNFEPYPSPRFNEERLTEIKAEWDRVLGQSTDSWSSCIMLPNKPPGMIGTGFCLSQNVIRRVDQLVGVNPHSPLYALYAERGADMEIGGHLEPVEMWANVTETSLDADVADGLPRVYQMQYPLILEELGRLVFADSIEGYVGLVRSPVMNDKSMSLVIARLEQIDAHRAAEREASTEGRRPASA